MTMPSHTASESPPELKRTLSLPMLTLYGLGTTIGAGIFVLLGAVAAEAGYSAPMAFIVASFLAGATALSFAELSSRFPLSAGEAVYIKVTLDSDRLAMITGFLVITVGTISSAAIASGFVGYLDVLIDLPDWLVLIVLVATLATVAVWGIAESVTVAAIFTVAEIGVLAVLVGAGAEHIVDPAHLARSFVVPLEASLWIGILSATVVAFYAFIGFEDMVNVAEEVRDVERVMPRAIILTLIGTLVIYVAVSLVATGALGPDRLADSSAPVADVFEEVAGGYSRTASLIALISVINGALIQIIMASRVLYGMAKMGAIPPAMGAVHPVTHTPVRATLLVSGTVLFLALLLPIESLARITSFFALIIFSMINFGLIRWKLRNRGADGFNVPMIVPVVGGVGSAGLVLYQLVISIAGAV